MRHRLADLGMRSSSKQVVCRKQLPISTRPASWIHHIGLVTSRHHAEKTVAARLLPRQAFLDNALWIQQQPTNLKIFQGDSSAHPPKQQLRVFTDILNAVGWYNGLRSPTKSLKPKAWWNNNSDKTDPSLYQSLCAICQTDDQIRELFNIARSMVTAIPCQRHPNTARHRYQVNKSAPFR